MIGLLFWICIFTIFYIYLGYPIILTILSIIFPKTYRSGYLKPKVTLIIAAYNEEQVIERKLINSLHLHYPVEKLQIIVAADGSDDQTINIVNRYSKRIELSFSPERRGKMSAINHAINLSNGQIVIFSDANNLYNSNAINLLIQPFSDPSVGAVTGSKQIIQGRSNLGDSEGLYWKYESFIKKRESILGSCTAVTGEILAVRRDLFDEAPEGIINDDFYVLLRVLNKGFRVIYEPAAVSSEEASLYPTDEISRRSRITAGRYQALSIASKFMPWKNPILVWQLISHKFLRPLVPFLMVFLILLNSLALFIPPDVQGSKLFLLSEPYNYIFAAIQVIFYLVAIIGNYYKKKNRFTKILYIPTFLVNSNFAAFLGLMKYINKKQSVTWNKVNRPEKAIIK